MSARSAGVNGDGFVGKAAMPAVPPAPLSTVLIVDDEPAVQDVMARIIDVREPIEPDRVGKNNA